MKNTVFHSFLPFLFVLTLAIAWSCSKKEETKPVSTAPSGVTTSAATSITPTGATISGAVGADGGAALTAIGVVYSNSNTTPTTDDEQAVASGTAVGSFTVTLTGLNGTTKYYARAFATNSVGITYGSVVEFTTTAAANIPTVTTAAANSITTATAKSGGDVPDDGGAAVTEKGIYYGDMENPGPSNGGIKVDGGTGTGSFISSITGLTEATTYHVRAYAKNSVGTGWGADLTFITAETGKPQVSTKQLSARTYSGITSGGTVSDQGGAGQTVTEWGLVWSTDATPTLANGTKVTGTAPFSSFNISLTGLTSGTKIYIRAYATNSPGNKTGYGQILSYTPPPTTVNYDGKTYNTVIIGNQVWFKENLNTKKYQNGDPLVYATSPASWVNSKNALVGAMCYWNFDNETHGALYSGYAVVDSRKLCPAGWKTPAYSDFTELVNYLGGAAVAGKKLKTSDSNWWNTPGDNSSGFSALGVGQMGTDGTFVEYKINTDISTNTFAGSGATLGIQALRITNSDASAGGGGPAGRGNPVRCLMEN